MSHITVRHADGTRESFSQKVFDRSLKRAHLNPKEIENIYQQLLDTLPKVVTTKELYQQVHKLINTKDKRCAQLYSVKRALQLMGPSGFPFEHLVGELMKHLGYHDVQVGVTLPGKCVTHEIDVLAKKDGGCALVECKFHRRAGLKSSVQTSLYVKARYDDITDAKSCKVNRCLIVTNTSFTTQAQAYAECQGIDVISWSYPRTGNLADLIEKYALYPITVLTELSPKDRRSLLKRGIVLCKDIISNQKLIKSLGLSDATLKMLDKDCRSLCKL